MRASPAWSTEPSTEHLPVVAVIGRPNVGKSTFVNRVIGRRDAIVEETPGVTRDRKIVEAEWTGHRFTLVDTGGWLADDEALARQVSRQAERAIREADLVILVVDATVGITEEDDQVAAILRRSGKETIVVANKVDDGSRESDIWAFAKLGLGDPYGVSALHGRSSGDLLDAVCERLSAMGLAVGPAGSEPSLGDHVRGDVRGDADGDEDGDTDDGDGDEEHDDDALASKPFGVAIVGRPNVGKSTLFNKLVGDERAVVHDMPGTTRDAIDTLVETDDGVVRFIDTAGMRRRSRIDEAPEYYGMLRALEAVDRADAALLVIDASEGVTQQDQRLAERVDASGCPIVIVLNKWDRVATEDRTDVLVDVADRLGFIGYAPVLKAGALAGRGVHRILPALYAARDDYRRRVPTAVLNRVLAEAQAAHPPPAVRGRRPRILYGTQAAIEPPTFALFVTRELPPNYMRFLDRRIREAFGFQATPIKIRVRLRHE